MKSLGLLFLFPLSLLLLLQDNTIFVSAQDNEDDVPVNNLLLELKHVFTRLGDNDDDSNSDAGVLPVIQNEERITVTSINKSDGSVVAIGSVSVDADGNCDEDGGGSEGRVVIWVNDVINNQWVPVNILRGDSTNPCDGVGERIQLSSSGQFLAVVRNNVAQLYDLISGSIINTIFGITPNTLFTMDGCETIEDDGDFVCYIALARVGENSSGNIEIYKGDTLIQAIPTAFGLKSSLSFSQNGQVVAVSNANTNLINLYSRSMGNDTIWNDAGTITAEEVQQIDLQFDGKALAFLTNDNKIQVYSNTESTTWTTVGSTLTTTSGMSFSSDGRRIAVASESSSIDVYVYDGENDWTVLEKRSMMEDEDAVLSGFDMTSSGNLILAGGQFNDGNTAANLYFVDVVITDPPTGQPTTSPTSPIMVPSSTPTLTEMPTTPSPTSMPTQSPTSLSNPTKSPVLSPTQAPVPNPTPSPTVQPTRPPTVEPTRPPTPLPTKSPTSPPTKSPTSPVQVPSDVPILTEDPTSLPTQTPTPLTNSTDPPLPPIGICFSSQNYVELQNGEYKSMKELKVGDFILVDQKKYEPIYAWGHYDTSSKATFVKFMPSELELSPNHLVYIEGKASPVPAGSVRVGDILVSTDKKSNKVTSVLTDIHRNDGVYAPFTSSGKIMIVNKKNNHYTMASTFVSVQYHEDKNNNNNDEYLHLGGGILSTYISHQWLARAFETPHRLLWSYSKNTNTDSPNVGISVWVEGPYRFFTRLLLPSTPLVIQIIIMIPILLLMTTAVVLEQLLLTNTMSVVVAVVAILTFAMTTSQKKKNRKKID